MNDIYITVDSRELAHCKMCWEPMYIIYDQSLRDYCHDCLTDMSLEAAREIVGDKRK